ncbi:MAG: biotin/lipoyl-binding protein, partial [Maioricimonas sp. JB049]
MQRRICLSIAAILLSPTGSLSGLLAQSPVIVSRVVEQDVRTGQTFVGTILPEKRATIGSAVGGRVVEFPVDEGDRVEEGQTLAQLLTNTINLELDAAQAELELRKHELEELENGTRPEEVAQARAQMEAARTALTFSEKRLERIQRLAARGDAATQDQLDESIAGRDNARATLEERTAAYELAVAGPRKEQ